MISSFDMVMAFDIVMLVLALWLGIKGCLRGFVRELMSLLGTLGGAWLAFHYCGQLGSWLNSFFPGFLSPRGWQIAAMVLIFLGAAIAASLLGRVIQLLVRFAWLGSVDRLLGFAAGLAKAVVIAIIVLYGIQLVQPMIPGLSVERSYTWKLTSGIREFVVPRLSQTL